MSGVPTTTPAPTDQLQWAQSVLDYLGAPQTTSNQEALAKWSDYESGVTANDPNFWTYRNPLSTSQPETGSSPFNSSGVQKYANWHTSYLATIAMLDQPGNSSIKQAFMGGDALKTLPQATAAAQWAGTSSSANESYAQALSSFFSGHPSASAAGGVQAGTGPGVVTDVLTAPEKVLAKLNPVTLLRDLAHNIGDAFKRDLYLVLEFVGGAAALYIGVKTLITGTTMIPELSWILLWGGAFLIWCAISLNSAGCELGAAMTGASSSCKLQTTGGFLEGLILLGGVYFAGSKLPT